MKLTEAEQIKRNIFILESKNSTDVIARTVLREGEEYNTYLALCEAPVGDVIAKIKGGLQKLPQQAASKAMAIVKKLPKAALPMAAAAILAVSASGAQAQDANVDSMISKLDQIEQSVNTMGDVAKSVTANATSKFITPEWSDKNSSDMKQYVAHIWSGEQTEYWVDAAREYLDQQKLKTTPEAADWAKQINKVERYINDGFSEADIRTINTALRKDPQSIIDYINNRELADTTTGQNVIKLANKYLNN